MDFYIPRFLAAWFELHRDKSHDRKRPATAPRTEPYTAEEFLPLHLQRKEDVEPAGGLRDMTREELTASMNHLAMVLCARDGGGA